MDIIYPISLYSVVSCTTASASYPITNVFNVVRNEHVSEQYLVNSSIATVVFSCTNTTSNVIGLYNITGNTVTASIRTTGDVLIEDLGSFDLTDSLSSVNDTDLWIPYSAVSTTHWVRITVSGTNPGFGGVDVGYSTSFDSMNFGLKLAPVDTSVLVDESFAFYYKKRFVGRRFSGVAVFDNTDRMPYRFKHIMNYFGPKPFGARLWDINDRNFVGSFIMNTKFSLKSAYNRRSAAVELIEAI